MLKNELKDIEEILFEQDYSDSNEIVKINLVNHFSHIHSAWENVIFSDISENNLVRYFHYHLELITTIADHLSSSTKTKAHIVSQNELLGLIDHLRKYYSNYFNEDAVAPAIYHERLICQLRANVDVVQKTLRVSNLNTSLKTCLLNWFDLMFDDIGTVKFTYRSLNYFEWITNQLVSLDFDLNDAETKLVALLIRSNFNSLSFFVYYQENIRSVLLSFADAHQKLKILNEQKAEVISFPEVKNIAYDPSWPSIKTMIGDWLTEEILLIEKSCSKSNEVAFPKIPLEMSVAHMSCLIRLLYEESVFATQNLQFIFKGFAGYFQSKRQAVISPGSLSKEFYSIDQHTAARVRDLLQRMVQRINRNFFPMVVAINAIALSYLSMR